MSAATRYYKSSLRITSPGQLLTAIPRLLGFRPESSIVILCLEEEHGRVAVTLRYDLPEPGDDSTVSDIAFHAAAILAAQHLSAVAAVGYGPGDRVTPAADTFRSQLAEAGITVQEFLRAEDQRYWSYLCTTPGCCPAEGTAYDTAGPVAEAMLADGPVLASREELAATIASVTGKDAEAMHTATRQAEEHAARLTARAARSGRKSGGRRLIAASGLDAVAEALKLYRDGAEFTSRNQAAWLSLVLRDLRVRDDAWARMDPRHMKAHTCLWTDLTRLARPGYVAPSASLLAFTAWQSGNGALANIALDRALADNPHYSMAQLLRQAIDAGAPPSMAQLPMTPEQVADSYDAIDDTDPEDDHGDEGADTEDEDVTA
jgi:Domain of unknown function (DUF4192)